MDNLNNWAGNRTYRAARLRRPASLDELRRLVAQLLNLKALGTRHAFNGIADTGADDGDLISLERFDQIAALDRENHTVVVEAGVRYGALGPYLHREGYALPNLASLPHISVAGACATATHGSGDGNGNLATAVSAIEMVTATGDLITLSRDNDPDGLFAGGVVGLGALGIVTKLTLDLTPTYAVRQVVYEGLPFAQLETHFDEIMASAYSVSAFTDWREEASNQIWLKQRVADEKGKREGEADGIGFTTEPVWFGARLATEPRHPVIRLPADNCTEQGGIPGPWQERLPHFRREFIPSVGEELQSEYLVPREYAVAAFSALRVLKERIAPLLQISEIRTVAADDLWMSPCYAQACAGFHFTWVKDEPAVFALLPVIEDALAPFSARPHWGKLFRTPQAQIRSLYPRLSDFQRLQRRLDPDGKFRNAFLNGYLSGPIA